MSDGQPGDPREGASRATKWAHDCAQCGDGAMFGFVGRRGDQAWYCMAHRETGRRQVMLSARSKE